MVVRKATLDDYDELCALIAEVDELHRSNLPQRFREPEGPTREWEYFRSVITDESVGFFVAEDDGELVGFVHVVVRDSRDFAILVPRRYAFVDSIAVREELRGTGIGRVLMEKGPRVGDVHGGDGDGVERVRVQRGCGCLLPQAGIPDDLSRDEQATGVTG